jgi:hypothetical protein
MNDDVLATIASFSDIDTRRALKCGPNRLVRDAVFDRQLQKIHMSRQIRWDGHSIWEVVLNDNIRVRYLYGIYRTEHYSTETGCCVASTIYNSVSDQLLAEMYIYDLDDAWVGDFNSTFRHGKWVPKRTYGYKHYLMDLYGRDKGKAMFKATWQKKN